MVFLRILQLSLFVVGGYFIYKFVKNAWEKADIKEKLDKVKEAEELASMVNIDADKFQENKNKVENFKNL
jgi:hypothetical protein